MPDQGYSVEEWDRLLIRDERGALRELDYEVDHGVLRLSRRMTLAEAARVGMRVSGIPVFHVNENETPAE